MFVFVQQYRFGHCYIGFDSFIIKFGTNFDNTINILVKKDRIITRARSYKKLKTGGRFYFASLIMSFSKKYKSGGVTWKHVSLF
jgi:hypothetical protein